jgi:glycosyltransferase involved in cell wall biosynthesis
LKYEIILVEDSSTDTTRLLIKNFLKSNKNICIIEHQKNQGRGKSVMDGIKLAKGKFVGFMDIDCEIDPAYISRCLKLLEDDIDVVCAERHYQTEARGVIREIASKIYRGLVQILFSSELTDTEAGYKFFDRAKIQSLLPLLKNPGWFWDTEVMIRAQQSGLRIAFLPVIFKRRSDKISTVHIVSDSVEYVKNLFVFRLKLWSESLQKGQV